MRKTFLINRENKWKTSYEKYWDLINIKDIDDNDIKIDKDTYKAYLELKEFLSSKGIIVGISSGFRSVEEQESLRDKLRKSRGEEYLEGYVAKCDESEHTTGLAIDLVLFIDGKYQDETEDAYKLFLDIHPFLKDFGFILRYPMGKEKITGYNYEPWHIRYVGRVISNIIYQNNYTLEEYLKYFSGVLYINKKKDMTSFDVVHEVSEIFGIKRVGHTGTLDPLAEGVLIVCIGEACKIVELITSRNKEYVSEVELGIFTDTLDITGNIIDKKEVSSYFDLEEVLKSFKKTYLQEVPIYSAVKVKGKKLYEYAREGKMIDLPKKEVTIYDIELLEKKNNSFKFRTVVSKGCYIRSLIRDIGEKLGELTCMKSLIRTRQGSVSIEDTCSLEEIIDSRVIHSIEEVLNYRVIVLDEEIEFKVRNGVKILDNWNIDDKVLFKNKDNKILGIYVKDGDYLKTWKNFSC